MRARRTPNLQQAVSEFWSVRTSQSRRQGRRTGLKDTGLRAAVTGGHQFDSLTRVLRQIIVSSGIPDKDIHTDVTVVPGFYRPSKEWDLVVVANGILLAVVECKAHIGPSFGNNYNNRVEEALGSSVDLLAAYREGAFSPGRRPWLGWLMLLEDVPRSNTPVKASEPHFPVRSEYRDASYAQRYEHFCTKLLRDRLYDGACLLLTARSDTGRVSYREPSVELGFANFAASLSAHTHAFAQFRA